MKTLHKWALLLVLTATSFILAACSGDEGQGQTQSDAGAGSAAQAAAEPDPDQETPTDGELESFESAPAAGVTVEWRVDGENLVVRASAETTGWVAVGFDPSRMMADANIIIGYVEDGQAFVSDDYGTGLTRHGPDTENGGRNDLVSFEGSEADGMTRISFTIPLDSGDAMDRPLQAGSTYRVIVAHGRDGADDFGSPHADRGSFEMEL